MFEKELKYFIKNQDDLVKKYNGKILVLCGKKVERAFDDNISAYNFIQKQSNPRKHMIQPCLPGPEAYTVWINSNLTVK